VTTCPTTSGVAVPYSVSFSPGSSTSVGVFGQIDPDSSPSTANGTEAGYPTNPFAIVAGETYTGINLELTPR
jgi:hypothetical protein